MTEIEIINDLLSKESRQEAKEILSKSTESDRQRFINYYIDDNEIASCMHLDYMKNLLVEKGEMDEGGYFGGDIFGIKG